MTQARTTVGIAGAGIMGRLLALRLQHAGYQVTLFDRDPIECGSAAAYTAAGMLAPYTELESAESLIYELGQRSLSLWPDIVAQLDAPEVFHSGGSLAVAHGQDAADLEHFNQLLARKLPGEPGIAFLDRQGLAELEPELAPQFGNATFLAAESWVYTDTLMAALADTLQANGALWHSQCEVSELQAKLIVSANGRHHFDWVADCRGLGAAEDLPGLRGVRGEVIEVYAPEVSISRMVRLMHPRYRLYLVPRANHHYLLGATQIESDDTSEISVRSALELLSALYAIHPAFAEARIVATRTNCRPALLDNQPLVRLEEGVLQVNGLYRHGYLLAPAMAERAQQLLDATQSSVKQAI
ncbi:glycine oxidase ThiO [Halioglobus japonicus]|uniref:D-amino-acid oxidase n=1 Tax=Halioglobus japonicus TaxID=930805 RepID=A0AAP8MD88_9GAMM|nr:glycine oxidase ThiO [Halioglobus japonicus]AQA17737.1 glycine oxidase ThiO [Halioglobus japonicus]PLW85688.1 glycine oxidase ThiO [Halioglobus japonicus]GHD16964.1 glycine oxidase ThiO [Halioglobus japonicus]